MLTRKTRRFDYEKLEAEMRLFSLRGLGFTHWRLAYQMCQRMTFADIPLFLTARHGSHRSWEQSGIRAALLRYGGMATARAKYIRGLKQGVRDP